MKILKTLVLVNHEGNARFGVCDTIEYQGEFWLVPGWLEAPEEGWKKPERIICLSRLPYEETPGVKGRDFALQCPVDKAVFDGHIPTGTEFEFVIVEEPEIRISIPKGVH